MVSAERFLGFSFFGCSSSFLLLPSLLLFLLFLLFVDLLLLLPPLLLPCNLRLLAAKEGELLRLGELDLFRLPLLLLLPLLLWVLCLFFWEDGAVLDRRSCRLPPLIFSVDPLRVNDLF